MSDPKHTERCVVVTLADCPPGLFQTPEGYWGFKTEYAHKSEADGRFYPEAYVVDSGEFFWGGASDHPTRAQLPVIPIDAEDIRHRTAAEAASRAEVERLRAERDFLLARASKAGSCSFGGGRWTGLSSNALVTVAFGGEDDCLPSDSSDLAACYRTMLRLPRHLLSDKVWEQLEDGERYVGSKYPDDIAWAKEAAEWPEAARAALTASDGGEA